MNADVKIIDLNDNFTERGYDTEGELYICSDTIMQGYYKRLVETADCIKG